MEQGKYREAIEIFNESIKIDPSHIPPWVNKGMAHIYNGEFDEGIKSLKKALKISPDDSQIKNLITNLINHQKIQTDLIPKEESIPKSVKDMFQKVFNLYQRGSFRECKELLQQIITIEPKLGEAWLIMGQLEFSLRNYTDSILFLKKALGLNPKSEIGWTTMGGCLDQLGKYEKAIECYDKALQLKPDYAPAWNNKGLALDILGKYQEAIICYKKALELNPHKAGNWFNKGETHLKVNNYDEALKCFLEVLKIEPNYQKAEEMVTFLQKKISSNENIREGFLCPRCGKKNYTKSSHCVYCKIKFAI